jgi:two-component system sensor histidine kinase BaeS
MVDDLQELASAEAAALQLSRTPCDLSALADTAASRLADSFDAAGVGLVRRLTRVQVLGDSGRIHEIVTNLLTNALKFTPALGRVLVEAGLHGQQAMLRVSDTGVGIPPDELPHICERFFRGDQASGVAGSGIGLTVVAELVQAHGGTLDVTSTPGQGTIFTVTLPRA